MCDEIFPERLFPATTAKVRKAVGVGTDTWMTEPSDHEKGILQNLQHLNCHIEKTAEIFLGGTQGRHTCSEHCHMQQKHVGKRVGVVRHHASPSCHRVPNRFSRVPGRSPPTVFAMLQRP